MLQKRAKIALTPSEKFQTGHSSRSLAFSPMFSSNMNRCLNLNYGKKRNKIVFSLESFGSCGSQNPYGSVQLSPTEWDDVHDNICVELLYYFKGYPP